MRERLGASEAEVERIVDGEAPAMAPRLAAAGKGNNKAGGNRNKEGLEGEWLTG